MDCLNEDGNLGEKFGYFLLFDFMFPKYLGFNHFSKVFAVKMIESYDIIVPLQNIYWREMEIYKGLEYACS